MAYGGFPRYSQWYIFILYCDFPPVTDIHPLVTVLSSISADAPPLPDVQPNDEEQEQEQQAKPETRSFLEVITSMMTTNDGNNSRPIPPEMQWNVCVLLEKIMEAAKGGKLYTWNVGDRHRIFTHMDLLSQFNIKLPSTRSK